MISCNVMAAPDNRAQEVVQGFPGDELADEISSRAKMLQNFTAVGQQAAEHAAKPAEDAEAVVADDFDQTNAAQDPARLSKDLLASNSGTAIDQNEPRRDDTRPARQTNEQGLPESLPEMSDTDQQDSDTVSKQPAIAAGDVKSKQALNREHQRRWRLRQKARSQAVQTQLAAAAAELAELKAKQQKLEAEPQTARKDAAAKNDVAEMFISEGSLDGEPFVPAQDINEYQEPVLHISLGGRQHRATAEQITACPLESFAALWTAYNVELKQCLVSLNEHADKAVEDRMLQLGLEALRIAGCQLLLNPAAVKHLLNGRMSHGNQPPHQLDHTFYVNLLILLGLSDSQVQDCMLLRQLYHTKRALLSMERRELLNQMTHVERQLPHPCEHVVVLTDLSTCLKDNSAESHLVHYRLARALYRGVLTTRQMTEIVVHSYPYMPTMQTLLDTLASQVGYPSQLEVTACAHLNPLKAEWQLFGSYARSIATNSTHDHIPLCSHNMASGSQNNQQM